MCIRACNRCKTDANLFLPGTKSKSIKHKERIGKKSEKKEIHQNFERRKRPETKRIVGRLLRQPHEKKDTKHTVTNNEMGTTFTADTD